MQLQTASDGVTVHTSGGLDNAQSVGGTQQHTTKTPGRSFLSRLSRKKKVQKSPVQAGDAAWHAEVHDSLPGAQEGSSAPGSPLSSGQVTARAPENQQSGKSATSSLLSTESAATMPPPLHLASITAAKPQEHLERQPSSPSGKAKANMPPTSSDKSLSLQSTSRKQQNSTPNSRFFGLFCIQSSPRPLKL